LLIVASFACALYAALVPDGWVQSVVLRFLADFGP